MIAYLWEAGREVERQGGGNLCFNVLWTRGQSAILGKHHVRTPIFAKLYCWDVINDAGAWGIMRPNNASNDFSFVFLPPLFIIQHWQSE